MRVAQRELRESENEVRALRAALQAAEAGLGVLQVLETSLAAVQAELNGLRAAVTDPLPAAHLLLNEVAKPAIRRWRTSCDAEGHSCSRTI